MQNSFIQRNYIYILLVLFSLPLFFLNIYDRHSWGDDFAQYIKEAENIANGKPYYISNYVYNDLNTGYAPPQYPPGYPLLLAPVAKLFGLNFKAFFYLNSLLCSFLLFVSYEYFKKYTSSFTALCMALIIVYSNVIIDLKGNILSDVPCLLFITLYLHLHNTEIFTRERLAALVIVSSLVVLIRSQGLLLLAAEGIYYSIMLLSKKEKLRKWYRSPSVIVILCTSILLLILNNTVFYTPNSTEHFYKGLATNYPRGFVATVSDNVNYLLSLFLIFFHFDTNAPLFQAPVSIIKYFGFVFAVIGFILSVKDKIKVDDVFFVLMCAFIILFPERQGIRFFVEAFQVYLLYILLSSREILQKILSFRRGMAIAGIFTLVYLGLGYDTYHKAAIAKCEGGMPIKRDSIIFEYINTHVPKSETVMFVKPRAIALFCVPRFVNYAWQASYEENEKQFRKLDVSYFLTGFDERDFVRNYFKELNIPHDSIQIIDDVYLYKKI